MAKIKEKGPREQMAPEAMASSHLEEEVLAHHCDPLTYRNLKKSAWPGFSALVVRFWVVPQVLSLHALKTVALASPGS